MLKGQESMSERAQLRKKRAERKPSCCTRAEMASIQIFLLLNMLNQHNLSPRLLEATLNSIRSLITPLIRVGLNAYGIQRIHIIFQMIDNSFKQNPNVSHRSSKSEPADELQMQDQNATAELFIADYTAKILDTQGSQSSKSIRRALQNIYCQIFITAIALFSLFSDDIRQASTEASADVAFDAVHIALIMIFLAETVLSFISMPEYRWSFFFFLDILSTLSIVLDISMITVLMYTSNDSSYNLNRLVAQSRASRVATRAVRIVKLVRIIRIVKLYKSAMQAKDLKEDMKRKKLEETKRKNVTRGETLTEKRSNQIHTELHQEQMENENPHAENTAGDFMVRDSNMAEPRPARQTQQQREKEREGEKEDNIFDADFMEQMSQKQSKISKVLSDLTVKKIIIAVLLLLFLIPLFDTGNYLDKAESWDYLVVKVHRLLYLNATIPLSTINELIEAQILEHQGEYPLLYFSTPFKELSHYSAEGLTSERVQFISQSVESVDCDQIRKYRPGLTLRENLPTSEDNEIYAVMNYKAYYQRSALFSIGKTLFICVVLVGMLHFFTEDINELIVSPIERMMQKVLEMAKNPESVTMGMLENHSNQYETAIVHNAIVKIGALLSLVFGAAGAEIIGSNIMQEGDMNPMVGGRKKCAIFGFCSIRNFTEVTENLHEDIMLFVNKIGELVHSSVYRYGGSANKNIGEAFLMVWPLPDDSYKINGQTNKITWRRQKYVSVMSDFSILSFIKAIVKINKEPAILDYRTDKRLTEGVSKDFQVKMGFGLHIGWAIEGAIGSEYKIDASYLSPNVNMASRLEAATKQYGVNILISEDLYEMSTASLKGFCRNVDRVTVKGSAKPIKLYTIDLKLENISPPMDKNIKYKNLDDMLDVEIKKQINMEYLEDDKIDSYNAEQFIRRKKQFREVMINASSEDFRKRFEMGLDSYIAGKWSDAKLHFGQALKSGKNDGPTRNILNYMKRSEYVAPQTWKNYRPLTEK